ncbi:DUF262 domain-containing protein [bacterium]|nr:DUF262 domain-containing protein [bacterium]
MDADEKPSVLEQEVAQRAGEIYTDSYPISIGEVISIYKDEELEIHPSFQRFFRWDAEQKSKFIESLLLGIPIPPIFVSQQQSGVWDVVDGVQRLSTIFEFVGILKDENGQLKPPLVLLPTRYLPNLGGVIWETQENDEHTTALPSGLRIDFKRKKLDFNIIKKESDQAAKYDLFQRINSLGSRLSDQEIRNCLLIMVNKDFYEWFATLAENDYFKQCTAILNDRLTQERFDMDLAARFIAFSIVDFNTLTGSFDVNDTVSDTMTDLASTPKEWDSARAVFEKCFQIIHDADPEYNFRRYEQEKDRYVGPLLVSAYECVAIGLARALSVNPQLSRDIIIERIRSLVKQMWDAADFRDNIGAGVRASTRIPRITEFGKNHILNEN